MTATTEPTYDLEHHTYRGERYGVPAELAGQALYEWTMASTPRDVEQAHEYLYTTDYDELAEEWGRELVLYIYWYLADAVRHCEFLIDENMRPCEDDWRLDR